MTTVDDLLINFNPRSHERSDVHCGQYTEVQKFQSTLPREERLRGQGVSVFRLKFQSTLPREERLWSMWKQACSSDFNPRSHERSDKALAERGVGGEKISIHAPTRGATLMDFKAQLASDIFQSTLPREERQCHAARFFKSTNFNPRSHERSDVFILSNSSSLRKISIHAPTRGATAILHKKFVYFYTIPTINI